jgi:signal transduction histidine kinase
VEAEKLAALGKLSANVAHELNTPLGAIRASANNTADALDESLAHLPVLFEQLTSDQHILFFRLLNDAGRKRQLLTSREERQARRRLCQELERHDIRQAYELADTLVDIGLVDDILPYLDLFRHPDNTQILRVVHNLAAYRHHRQTVLTAVERASKVVSALKMYAEIDQSTEPQMLINIPESLDKVLNLYRNHLQHGIELVKRFEAVPGIFSWSGELHLVWTHLLQNAIQAMKGHGRLEVSIICECNADSREFSPSNLPLPLSNLQYIVVEISDSGEGIPENIQARIFEPFFTTKLAGEGSGLGLDLCRKIVEKHHGSIEFQSQPGRTTFRVFLPVITS